MKQLLDKLFPTLSDELIIVITLIICLLVTASIALFLVKKLSPKTNISELVARTRSWWIMAAMFIGAVFISYDISYFFLAFLSFIAFRELYSVLGFREADRRALFWGILAIPIQYYLAYIAWYGAYIIFIPVVMFLLLPLRLVLKGDTHGITKSIALLQWILMLSVFGISHLASLVTRIAGLQCGRTRTADVPRVPYRNQRYHAVRLGKTLRTSQNSAQSESQQNMGRLFGRCRQHYGYRILSGIPHSALHAQRNSGQRPHCHCRICGRCSHLGHQT